MKIIKYEKIIIGIILFLYLTYCKKIKRGIKDEEEEIHHGRNIRNEVENLEENEGYNCGPYLTCYGIRPRCCYRTRGDSYICVMNQCPIGLIRK